MAVPLGKKNGHKYNSLHVKSMLTTCYFQCSYSVSYSGGFIFVSLKTPVLTCYGTIAATADMLNRPISFTISYRPGSGVLFFLDKQYTPFTQYGFVFSISSNCDVIPSKAVIESYYKAEIVMSYAVTVMSYKKVGVTAMSHKKVAVTLMSYKKVAVTVMSHKE